MITISDAQTFQLGKLHSLSAVGKEAFFSTARSDWLFMPTKLTWCAKKRGSRKVKIRKGSTFVHKVQKLVPKDKKTTLSTKGSLKCSWQEPTPELLVRGRQKLVQCFLYFVGLWVFPITPPVEIYLMGNFTLSEMVWRRREDRCSCSYMYFFLCSSN